MVKSKVIYFNVCKLYFYNFWYGIPCIVETKLHFSSNSMYATTRQKKINPQINFHTVLNFLFVCTGAVFSFYSNWIILQIKWKFKLYSMVQGFCKQLITSNYCRKKQNYGYSVSVVANEALSKHSTISMIHSDTNLSINSCHLYHEKMVVGFYYGFICGTNHER